MHLPDSETEINKALVSFLQSSVFLWISVFNNGIANHNVLSLLYILKKIKAILNFFIHPNLCICAAEHICCALDNPWLFALAVV